MFRLRTQKITTCILSGENVAAEICRCGCILVVTSLVSNGGIGDRCELGHDFISQVEAIYGGGSLERQQDPESEAV